MKVLYAHADCANLGDTLVEAGAKYLVHRAIGWHFFHQVSLRGIEHWKPQMQYDWLALVGTPWFWDGFITSAKYDMLRRLAGFVNFSRKMALGIGGCYVLGLVPEDQPHEPAWEHFGLVVCRDQIAQRFVPGARLLCCPSLFCAQAFGTPPARPSQPLVLVYADLDCGSVNAGHLSAEARFEFFEYQEKLIRDGVPVMTMTGLDRGAFERNYPDHPAAHLDDPETLLLALSDYREVISARVHACAAALSLGLQARVWPVDTRALTVTGCGAEPLQPVPEHPPIDCREESWIALLKATL